MEPQIIQDHEENADDKWNNRKYTQNEEIILLFVFSGWVCNVQNDADDILKEADGIKYGISVARLSYFWQYIIEYEDKTQNQREYETVYPSVGAKRRPVKHKHPKPHDDCMDWEADQCPETEIKVLIPFGVSPVLSIYHSGNKLATMAIDRMRDTEINKTV